MTPLPSGLKRHAAELLTLAWPVMLSRFGILLMAMVDIVMLGHYRTGAAGTLNLALAVFVPVLVVAIGLCSGLVPVVSRAWGAGAWLECGRAWRRAMSQGAALSVVAVLIVFQTETLLLLFGQTPETAAAGGAAADALALGIPAQVLFAVSAFYMESTRRPHVALVAMLAANLANFAFNWVLIFGQLGMPELGATGAAAASTLARFVALAVILRAVLGQKNPVEAGVKGPWEGFWGPGGRRAGRRMRRLGLSAGISNGFETFGFAAMTMFAGRLGTQALDAYAVAYNIMSTVFMVGLGLSIATGVRVGAAAGRRKPTEAAIAGWTGLGAGFVVMSLIGLPIWIGSAEIARFYSADPEVIARAAGLCLIVALIHIPDCGQVVLGQAVRAMGDAWIPILCYFASFTVFMIPAGWAMVNGLGWDERGLLLAILAACWIAVLLLGFRFRTLARRAHERRR